jgi:hypothetical protein
LQLSRKGIKYRGPYWPQRKTINWDQVVQIYISPELIVVVHKPQPNKKRLLPMLITSIYLADRDKIPKAVLKYCPITPVVMTSPHLFSRILLVLGFLAIVFWILEMLVRW